ncbi:GIY-YIG nuclease family protein [Aquisalibacillus elongatus]|uniref:Putative endonuclease n=1 Tax=Aquisalibacillus elongatus TaxID=485577 RepID=A0A3N5B4B5_9BACI|nr:putative endonuclease [Aquisalibacillus elongatus]
MHYTYMLRCRDKSLYTGYTNDLDKRLKKHLEGKASKFTRTRLPVEIVYYETFETKSEAMSREAKIKQLSKVEKESLIRK